MGEFRWEQETLGSRLVVWETTPPDNYAILVLAGRSGWSVSLQREGFPIQTVTGLETFTAAQQTATRFQFQLAVGDIDTTYLPHLSQ